MDSPHRVMSRVSRALGQKNLPRSHGLESQKISGRRRGIFLDFPFYRTGFSVTDFSRRRATHYEKLLTLVAQRVADGRVLRLIKAMLKAGSYGKGQLFPSQRGTPQGGVISPLLSNVLLTPFDQELRRKGYQLTRFADDWVITCKSA